MAEPPPFYPFTTFNFAVEFVVPGLQGASSPLCGGAFSECDGLEMSMDVKTIREGGNNGRQIRLTGPASFGQLTLKRGMTASFDLWKWFSEVQRRPGLRVDGEVVLFSAEVGGTQGRPEQARFFLSRCLPVKLKAPALNAKDGLIAIEELQVAYEMLELRPPKGAKSG